MTTYAELVDQIRDYTETDSNVFTTTIVNDFISKGEDLERIVLIRALKLHTERKVMIDNNKTIIFN